MAGTCVYDALMKMLYLYLVVVHGGFVTVYAHKSLIAD